MRWTINLDGVVNQYGCSHWKSVSKLNSCPQESVYYNVLIAKILISMNVDFVDFVDFLPGTSNRQITLSEA
jgi:hypothetical protein